MSNVNKSAYIIAASLQLISSPDLSPPPHLWASLSCMLLVFLCFVVFAILLLLLKIIAIQ